MPGPGRRLGGRARHARRHHEAHALLELHVHRFEASARDERHVAADLVAQRQIDRDLLVVDLDAELREVLERDEAEQPHRHARPGHRHHLGEARLLVLLREQAHEVPHRAVQRLDDGDAVEAPLEGGHQRLEDDEAGRHAGGEYHDDADGQPHAAGVDPVRQQELERAAQHRFGRDHQPDQHGQGDDDGQRHGEAAEEGGQQVASGHVALLAGAAETDADLRPSA